MKKLILAIGALWATAGVAAAANLSLLPQANGLDLSDLVDGLLDAIGGLL